MEWVSGNANLQCDPQVDNHARNFEAVAPADWYMPAAYVADPPSRDPGPWAPRPSVWSDRLIVRVLICTGEALPPGLTPQGPVRSLSSAPSPRGRLSIRGLPTEAGGGGKRAGPPQAHSFITVKQDGVLLFSIARLSGGFA
jgi:hypothetical protein